MIRILPADEREAVALRRTLGSVEGIRFVEVDETDPALLLRLGEADLAVLYGRPASDLLADAERPLRLSRAPGWDRIYFLWSGDRRRWVNDPSFRRWLAGAVERESLLRFLFDGRGAPAYSLSVPGPAAPARPTAGPPPFGRDVRPRLSLRFDRHDPHARSIAARLKAELDSHGLELNLLEREAEELDEELRGRDLELALAVHRATSGDAAQALGGTLRRLGHSGDGATRIERTLLEQDRLVPLVRLDAWLATPHALKGVTAGAYGELRLEKARWRR